MDNLRRNKTRLMKFLLQKITVGLVLVAMLASSVSPAAVLLIPQKAEAQGGACIGNLLTGVVSLVIGTALSFLTVPTGDMVNKATHDINATFSGGSFISDCIIKPMVKALVKQLIHQFLTSIVDWINNGFDGSGPRFVSDPASFFADIADRAVGEFVLNDKELAFLCNPYSIRLALGLSYWGGGFRDRVSCTLSQIMQNSRNAVDGFMAITTQPQNNPFGAYSLAQAELEFRIANQQSLAKTETDWGAGFLATKRCSMVEPLSDQPAGGKAPNIQWIGDYGYDMNTDSGDPITKCNKWETVTPGTTIKEGLSKSLGSQIDEYVNAEDIDAIFGALYNQLIGQIFSTAGLFAGGFNRTNYRQQFYNQLNSGAFDVGAAATLPTGFSNADCATLDQYVLLTDLAGATTVQRISGTGTAPAGPPWTQTSYNQLVRYCGQQPFWQNAGTATNSVVGTLANGAGSTPPPADPRFNLALGGRAFMTNEYDYNAGEIQIHGGAQAAIDGNRTIGFGGISGGGTFTISTPGTSSNRWWVELNNPNNEYIDTVYIYQVLGQSDGAGRMNNYPLGPATLTVTDANGQNHTLSITPTTSVNPIIVDMKTAFGYPFVPKTFTIEVPSGNLAFTEVEVMSHPRPVVYYKQGATINNSVAYGTTFNPLADILAANILAKDFNNNPITNIQVTSVIGPNNSTNFDTSVAGAYTITYTATDNQGVPSRPFQRTVVVLSQVGGQPQ